MTSVLITGMTTNLGGAESLVFNYVSRLADKIDFDFWCSNERCAYESELTELGCTIYHGTPYGTNISAAHRDTSDFFSKHASNYDALWANKSMLVNIDDIRLAKRNGIPRIILHSHNSRNMFSGLSGQAKGLLHRINRIPANRMATDFWACSQDAGQYFFTKLNRTSTHYLFVPNAIATDQFTFNQETRSKKRLELGIKDTNMVIGFVGRLQYQKDPELLMRIFIAYHALNKDSILLVVGAGELEDICRVIIHEAGLDSAVKFLGSRQDVPELYQAMDAFCLPSRFEGLGIVAIEAQTAGLPTIVASSLPPEAAITALFIPVSRNEIPESWAIEISKHVAKSSQRTTMTAQIRASGFDIDSAAEQLLPKFMK